MTQKVLENILRAHAVETYEVKDLTSHAPVIRTLHSLEPKQLMHDLQSVVPGAFQLKWERLNHYPENAKNVKVECAEEPEPTAEVVIKIGTRGMLGIEREVRQEILKAMANWPPYNSAHEGFSIIAEEMDELWEHVKTNQANRNLVAMRKECIQIAAVAERFIIDICDGGRGRK